MFDALQPGQEPTSGSQEPPALTAARGRRYLPWYPIAGAEGPPAASPPANPPANPPPAEPPPATPPPSPPPAGQEPPERYDADYVRDLRRSEAATRKKATELEARLKEFEDAKLGEQERLSKQLGEAQAALAEVQAERQALVVRHAVEREAAGLGFVDPSDAYAFLDLAALETDDAGLPRNVKRLLEAVLQAKPYLKGTAGGTAGVPATPRATGTPTPDQAVDEAAKKLQATGNYRPGVF